MTILHDNSMKFVLLQIEIEEKKTKIHAYQAKFGLKEEMRFFFKKRKRKIKSSELFLIAQSTFSNMVEMAIYSAVCVSHRRTENLTRDEKETIT